jgi:hypothetical protein
MNYKFTSHLSSSKGKSYYPLKHASGRGKKHRPFVHSQYTQSKPSHCLHPHLHPHPETERGLYPGCESTCREAPTHLVSVTS